MHVIARFHRWRLAQTTYWLQYEEQLHQLLVSDPRLAAVKEALRDQIATLHVAYRSPALSELAATYSYRCSTFYGVWDDFTLCHVDAANAQGVVCFGGGMLSQIRLTPTETVRNPKTFRLEGARLTDISIPAVTSPLAASGWIAELEGKGILSRFGAPREAVSAASDHPAHQQYAELFAQCASASFNLDSERFYFLSPVASRPVNSRKIGEWLPVLDLRELGGLAITNARSGAVEVSLLEDGVIVWSEPTLAGALERLHAEFGK